MANIRISGRQVAAARALAGVGPADFAKIAGLPEESLRNLEASGARLQSSSDIDAICRALDHFGVLIVDESADFGPGVRLKFTREDVRELARLEGEGGIIGSDDAP